MKRVKFCFLILHYKDYKMTKQAVESILSLDYLSDYAIVIVNNASPDQSDVLLKKAYGNAENVYLIDSEENWGFSKGNNLGYQFIKENFSPDFLICANNDVLFIQEDFLCKLEQLYMKQSFYICGPDIYVPWRDYHSNPLSKVNPYTTLREIEKQNREIDKRLATYKKLFSPKTFKLYLGQKARKNALMQKIYRIVRNIQKKTDYRNFQVNVILNGACLIFDKRFIDKNSKLFTPETFIYGEEHILGIRCGRNNWNTIYFPEIVVHHLHEGNSNLGNMGYKEFCEYLIKKGIFQKEAFNVLEKYIKEGR